MLYWRNINEATWHVYSSCPARQKDDFEVRHTLSKGAVVCEVCRAKNFGKSTDPAIESALDEQQTLRENLKVQIESMSTHAQHERYVELDRKVVDRVILTPKELEEFVLLRESLKQKRS